MMETTLALSFHILGAVVWVGGMFAAYVCLRPAAGVLEGPQRLKLWRGFFAKFFPWVWISLVVHADPRVRAYAIFRHAGAEVFDPSGLGARRVCLAAAAGCSDRVRRPGVYRYAAEAVDAWNASQPVFYAPVGLRRGRRRPR